MTIRLLPTDISSKIAAGEVIERPASIVKELIENSLDAMATEINIEINHGGIEYIRVVDNGFGIPKQEVELAFQRFATSKISKSQDLSNISTLGFRGEALPSIASVSNVSLITKTSSDLAGTRIDVHGGKTINIAYQGSATGTSITVKQLFGNFPARLKFLKSMSAETSRIQILVSKYILAYPQIRFHLMLDNSSTYISSGSGKLQDAISVVYNPGIANSMLNLEAAQSNKEIGNIELSGMISHPSLTRASRKQISLFVNGRLIQNRSLSYAIEEAYRNFIAERRFPLAIINLKIAYNQVDVNTHPSKTEVRFQNDQSIFSTCQQIVRNTLISHVPVPEINDTYLRSNHSMFQTINPTKHYRDKNIASGTPGPTIDLQPDMNVSDPSYTENLVPKNALPILRIIGQLKTTYLLAEGPDGLYLIDQHAAHERILFEQITIANKNIEPQTQGLIDPITIELDYTQKELFESHKELLTKLGFQVDSFGARTYIIRGIPKLLADSLPQPTILTEILETISEGGKFENWEERAAYSIACHGAIRAGKTLSQSEMYQLTTQLEKCSQPHTCPHGRPTMIHMSTERLEKEFGRK